MSVSNEIKVYATQVLEPWPKATFDGLMELIPQELQELVLKEEGWENQHGNLARKLMLWYGMEQMGADMNDLFESVQYTESGKPYIVEAPHFSLANDGAVAVCAISEISTLGIDVERMKPLNLANYREMMTYMEWREIYSHMIPLKRFYEFWTIKESVIKADGTQVNPDIKEIYIQPDSAFFNANDWYIHPIDFEYYGYVAIMVCSDPHADVDVIQVDIPTLFADGKLVSAAR